jgi:hypothetical protein
LWPRPARRQLRAGSEDRSPAAFGAWADESWGNDFTISSGSGTDADGNPTLTFTT